MEDRETNKLEMINELFVCFCTIMFVSFTDFVDDPFTKYEAGWYSIGLFLVFLVINTAVVLRDSFKHANLVRMKYTNIISFHYDKFRNQKELKQEEEPNDTVNIFDLKPEDRKKILTKDDQDCDINVLI